ncbi:myb-like protein D [Gordionus sp. m RMFG-2023]|uniref:myb-like protein D n=1 Tax=Gordionus sp. m RMFG-2023 TaxID=3053472 RepID=UPI0031FC6C32
MIPYNLLSIKIPKSPTPPINLKDKLFKWSCAQNQQNKLEHKNYNLPKTPPMPETVKKYMLCRSRNDYTTTFENLTQDSLDIYDNQTNSYLSDTKNFTQLQNDIDFVTFQKENDYDNQKNMLRATNPKTLDFDQNERNLLDINLTTHNPACSKLTSAHMHFMSTSYHSILSPEKTKPLETIKGKRRSKYNKSSSQSRIVNDQKSNPLDGNGHSSGYNKNNDINTDTIKRDKENVSDVNGINGNQLFGEVIFSPGLTKDFADLKKRNSKSDSSKKGAKRSKRSSKKF